MAKKINSTLTKIVAKAKILYKTGHYKKWTDAIKAASKGTAAPAKRKKAPAKKRTVKAKVKKTPAIKKVRSKSKKNTISGNLMPDKGFFKTRQFIENDIRFSLKQIEHFKSRLSIEKNKTEKNYLRKEITNWKKLLTGLKKQLRQQNVIINIALK